MTVSTLNAVDIIIVSILLLSATFAYFRGFLHEVLSIAGWGGASAAVLFGLPTVRPYLEDKIEPAWAADAVGATALFILAFIFFSLISHFITGHVRKSSLNILDRTMGFLFGLLRGALFVIIGYIGFSLLMPPKNHPDWMKKARFLPLVTMASETVLDWVPDDFMPTFDAPLKKKKSDDLFEKLKKPEAGDTKEESDKSEEKGYSEEARDDLTQLIESRVQDAMDSATEELLKTPKDGE